MLFPYVLLWVVLILAGSVGISLLNLGTAFAFLAGLVWGATVTLLLMARYADKQL